MGVGVGGGGCPDVTDDGLRYATLTRGTETIIAEPQQDGSLVVYDPLSQTPLHTFTTGPKGDSHAALQAGRRTEPLLVC
jgi:hypothetical protein